MDFKFKYFILGNPMIIKYGCNTDFEKSAVIEYLRHFDEKISYYSVGNMLLIVDFDDEVGYNMASMEIINRMNTNDSA
jgi:hypothetical protein